MKKFLRSVFVLLFIVANLAGCTASCVATTQTSNRYIGYPENVSHVMDSTVALMIRNPLTGQLQIGCSGFFVSSTRIVTAEHCVAIYEPVVSMDAHGEPSVEIARLTPSVGDEIYYVTHRDWETWSNQNHTYNPQPASHIARVAVWDVHTDVAVLAIENPNLNSSGEWLQVRTSEARPGESTFTVGQPLLFRWIMSEGIVSFVEYINDSDINRVMVGSTSPIYPGSSGSPLMDNMGMVIGIADMIAYNQPTLGLFSPAVNIRMLLTKIPAGY